MLRKAAASVQSYENSAASARWRVRSRRRFAGVDGCYKHWRPMMACRNRTSPNPQRGALRVRSALDDRVIPLLLLLQVTEIVEGGSKVEDFLTRQPGRGIQPDATSVWILASAEVTAARKALNLSVIGLGKAEPILSPSVLGSPPLQSGAVKNACRAERDPPA